MTDQRLTRPTWRGRTNVDALTIACLEHAEQLAGHKFTITQGSYQAGAGDPDSSGTHDRGGVVDLAPCHPVCIWHLRAAGMAAWDRTPEQGPGPRHTHAVVLGHPDLAPAAARQVIAYTAGRNGLADDGPDDGPRITPIPRPPWPPKEQTMQIDIDRIAEQVAARVMTSTVTVTTPAGKRRTLTLSQLLRELHQRQAEEKGA